MIFTTIDNMILKSHYFMIEGTNKHVKLSQFKSISFSKGL